MALGLLVVVCGCANPHRASQLRMPEAEFRQTVKTICLTSVDLSNKLPQHDAAVASIESRLTEILQRSGFTVLPSKFYADAWRRNVQKIGGYYDPMSGERDPAKYKRVVEDTLHEVLTQQHPDAVLYPSVEVVRARFGGGIARWDGVEEAVSSSWDDEAGTVGALSLYIVVQDSKGTELYAGSGGIQPLSTIVNGSFVPVVVESLLADEQQLTRAAFIALGELLGPPSASVRDCVAHSATELLVHRSGPAERRSPVEVSDDFLKSTRGQHLRIQCELRMWTASAAGTIASPPPP